MRCPRSSSPPSEQDPGLPGSRLTALLILGAVGVSVPAARGAALEVQPLAPWPVANPAGRVHPVLATGPGTDPVTDRPSRATKRFFAAHYWRVLGYAGYWDRRNDWYAGWLYQDAYAIYRGAVGRQRRHILRDAAGRPLSIDW